MRHCHSAEVIDFEVIGKWKTQGISPDTPACKGFVNSSNPQHCDRPSCKTWFRRHFEPQLWNEPKSYVHQEPWGKKLNCLLSTGKKSHLPDNRDSFLQQLLFPCSAALLSRQRIHDWKREDGKRACGSHLTWWGWVKCRICLPHPIGNLVLSMTKIIMNWFSCKDIITCARIVPDCLNL